MSADLTFDARDDLVDLVSEDRLRASTDGRSFAAQAWSTPLSGHRRSNGRRIVVAGTGQWHAPRPEGVFTYVELHFDDVAYNVQAVEHEWPASQALEEVLR